jgi:hypothetical protein
MRLKIFVDCDEDAFIIEKDVLEIKDSLSEIGKNREVIVDQTELDQLFSRRSRNFSYLSYRFERITTHVSLGKIGISRQAVESGKGTYFSRSRIESGSRGEESGSHSEFKNDFRVRQPILYYL